MISGEFLVQQNTEQVWFSFLSCDFLNLLHFMGNSSCSHFLSALGVALVYSLWWTVRFKFFHFWKSICIQATTPIMSCDQLFKDIAMESYRIGLNCKISNWLYNWTIMWAWYDPHVLTYTFLYPCYMVYCNNNQHQANNDQFSVYSAPVCKRFCFSKNILNIFRFTTQLN